MLAQRPTIVDAPKARSLRHKGLVPASQTLVPTLPRIRCPLCPGAPPQVCAFG